MCFLYLVDVVCLFNVCSCYFVRGGHVRRVCCVADPLIMTDRRRRGGNLLHLHGVCQAWNAGKASGWCYDSGCLVVVPRLL